jgi:uncharacterized RDD family membrane protein YckC
VTAPESATPAHGPGRGAAPHVPNRAASGPPGVPHPRTDGEHVPTWPPRPPAPPYRPPYPPPGFPAAVAGYRPPGYPPGGVVYVPARRVAPGGAPVADFGSRLAAYLLDTLIMLPVAVVAELLGFGLGFLLLRLDFEAGPSVRFVAFWAVAMLVALVVVLAAQYWYFVTYQVRHGQTIGRRTLKIKVVSAVDGSPMTRRQAVRRWVVQYPGGGIAPYFSWVDGLWQLGSEPYRQCLHDLCADTVVVEVPAAGPEGHAAHAGRRGE